MFNARRIGSILPITLSVLVALFGFGCRHTGSPSRAQNPAPRSPGAAESADPAKSIGPGSIRSEIGFTSRRKFLEHYDKHGAEFGGISKEEYLRQAQILRDSPAAGNILELAREDGVVTRFDRKTGAFLAFNRDLTIRTFFKPNDGERYFVRQSKRQPRDE